MHPTTIPTRIETYLNPYSNKKLLIHAKTHALQESLHQLKRCAARGTLLESLLEYETNLLMQNIYPIRIPTTIENAMHLNAPYCNPYSNKIRNCGLKNTHPTGTPMRIEKAVNNNTLLESLLKENRWDNMHPTRIPTNSKWLSALVNVRHTLLESLHDSTSPHRATPEYSEYMLCNYP